MFDLAIQITLTVGSFYISSGYFGSRELASTISFFNLLVIEECEADTRTFAS